MSPEMRHILESKRRARERLAALSFTEKLAILEKLRERSMILATNSLRVKPA